MKRLIGLILFSIAIGMLIMLFLSSNLAGILVAAILILIGYNLFCCGG